MSVRPLHICYTHPYYFVQYCSWFRLCNCTECNNCIEQEKKITNFIVFFHTETHSIWFRCILKKIYVHRFDDDYCWFFLLYFVVEKCNVVAINSTHSHVMTSWLEWRANESAGLRNTDRTLWIFKVENNIVEILTGLHQNFFPNCTRNSRLTGSKRSDGLKPRFFSMIQLLLVLYERRRWNIGVWFTFRFVGRFGLYEDVLSERCIFNNYLKHASCFVWRNRNNAREFVYDKNTRKCF